MKKNFILVFLSFIFINNIFSFENKDENQKNSTFERIISEIIKKNEDLKFNNPEFKIDEIKNDPRVFVKVSAKDKFERTKLLSLGLDILDISKDSVSGLIHKNQLSKINEKEFLILERKSFYDWTKEFEKDFPVQDSAYHNYKETYDLLKEIANKNPEITSLYSIGKTIENRDIWVLRINTNVKGDNQSSKPGALFVGTHHAREHLSNEVPLLFAAYLMDNKNKPEIKKYIDNLDIFIMPLFNPDGAEYDIATGKYRWHRKNARKNSDGSIGVDLNRNYDTTWGQYGSSTYPGSDTYCGTGPFSEPETQKMRDFILKHKNIITLQSYHSYASLILYPWGADYNPIANEKDRNAFIKMANEMGKLTSYNPQQSSDLYAASGDLCDWAYANAKIFAFTTELDGRSFYPGASIIKEVVDKNIKAAVYLLSMTDNPYK